jgi:hypothetical protein
MKLQKVKMVFIFIAFIFFIRFSSIACEPIYSLTNFDKYYLMPQRCYVVPDLSGVEPESCNFLYDSDYLYIYEERFFIDGKSISRFSYDNRDQMNCFAIQFEVNDI